MEPFAVRQASRATAAAPRSLMTRFASVVSTLPVIDSSAFGHSSSTSDIARCTNDAGPPTTSVASLMSRELTSSTLSQSHSQPFGFIVMVP